MTGSGDVAVFDRFAPAYDWVMRFARTSKLRAGLARAERPVERVADVAGGAGRGVRSLDVADPVVVDAAPRMLQRARSRGLAVVCGDATRLPLRTGSVDAVLIVDALHHIGDRDGAIREATRVVAPGGVVVVADFDPGTVRGWLLATGERVVGFDSVFDPPGEIAARMRAAGLDAEVVVDGFGYVVAGVPGEQSRSTPERRA